MADRGRSAAAPAGQLRPVADARHGAGAVVDLHAYRSDGTRTAPRPSIHDFPRVCGFYERRVKRPLDIVLAVLLLILLLPLLATISLAVRLSMGSKVFFLQERVGRNGGTIRMVKFRSMHPDRRRARPEPFVGVDRRVTHKTVDDPRHTGVGRFIRKWSLDELPQLWNVLKGDMSLVGPRPELVQIAERFDLVEHARHLVRPGITGLWQVSDQRNSLLHENVHIDLDYVERITFVGDLTIMLRTFGSLVRVRGS